MSGESYSREESAASSRLAVLSVPTPPANPAGWFDKFGKTLMPILQQIGLDAGQPTVMDIHKVILPAPNVAAAKKRAKPVARPRLR